MSFRPLSSRSIPPSTPSTPSTAAGATPAATSAGRVPRPLWLSYLGILAPMILTNALQAASGTVDGIWIGQMLGVDAIAAVSAFFPLLFLALALVIGLASGATVLIGQAWGAGDRAGVRRIAATAVAMLAALGLVLGLGGPLAAARLMQALGTPPAILPAAVDYAAMMMAGSPAIFLLWLATAMSRGVGDAVTPLGAFAVAGCVSLAATPALIAGWGGLPRCGAASAAISATGGAAAALAWMAWHWRGTGHPLAPAWPRRFGFDSRLARRILAIGLPTALQMATMALAEIVMLGIVNRHGAGATAIYGATSQVLSWVQFPVMSIGITATVLAAHMIGAGRPEAVGRVMATGLWLNLAVTGLVVAIASIAAPSALGLFLTEAALVDQAAGLLRLMLWSLVFSGWSAVLTGIMRADGTVMMPTLLAMAAIGVVEVPVAYLAAQRLGLPGVWIGYAAAFTAMPLMQGAYYRWVWSRRPARRLV